LGVTAYLYKEGASNEDVTRHLRALALRRAVNVARPEISKDISEIAVASTDVEDALLAFFNKRLIPEMKTCLGVPFFLLMTYGNNFNGADGERTIYCGGSFEWPKRGRLYETIQAYAHSDADDTEPITLQANSLPSPLNEIEHLMVEKIKISHPHKNKRLPRQIVIPWLEELTPDFRQFCAARDLAITPLFNGPCEIRFFLQRMNEHAMEHTSAEIAVRVVERKRENEVFSPYELNHSPSMMLTSSFHQSDQVHFSVARKEINEIVRLTWQGSSTPITHNAIDVERLRHVLLSASTPRHLTVWLHMGHGEKGGCLREYSQSFREAAEWLACFGGASEKRSLALVFFSACHSIEIAQRFAEAGVGVAIGFENKVDPATCQQISVPVIHAAWKTNGSRGAILDAFRRSVAAPTLGIRQAKPLAFHA
jgi:hypothetical protein